MTTNQPTAGFRCLKASPEMLADLRGDKQTMKLAGSYSDNSRMNFAFAFGYKFGAYAKGMTTWETEAARFGYDAKQMNSNQQKHTQ